MATWDRHRIGAPGIAIGEVGGRPSSLKYARSVHRVNAREGNLSPAMLNTPFAPASRFTGIHDNCKLIWKRLAVGVGMERCVKNRRLKGPGHVQRTSKHPTPHAADPGRRVGDAQRAGCAALPRIEPGPAVRSNTPRVPRSGRSLNDRAPGAYLLSTGCTRSIL
jgi:hypothetical protein